MKKCSRSGALKQNLKIEHIQNAEKKKEREKVEFRIITELFDQRMCINLQKLKLIFSKCKAVAHTRYPLSVYKPQK